MDSAPVSASSAASGGATGLDGELPKEQSLFRRHPIATGIASGVLTVIVVSGLTAWGVGTAVTSSLTSSQSSPMQMGTPTSSPQPDSTAAPQASGNTTGARVAFRATIQSIDGDSWTILTRHGKTVTVSIDGATKFGTKQAAATASSFAVGDNVIIVAMRGTGGTPTATRVVVAPTGS
jgi:phosphopantothenate synthetase